MQELISKIKEKKELKHLADSFVRKEVKEYLKRNHKAKTYLEGKYNPRSSQYKHIVKEVRSNLRRVHGLFRPSKSATPLERHASTKERLPHYKKIYKQIFAITGKPKRIIDLGCGLNPFSLPYMRLKDLNYQAFDINTKDIGLLNDFFSTTQAKNPFFSGEAHILDILRLAPLQKIPHADIAFLLKMSDVLDRGKGHKQTEKVLSGIRAKYVVLSFPTFTMSGKKMNFPRRKWVELLCERLGYQFSLLEFPNEIFYVLKK